MGDGMMGDEKLTVLRKSINSLHEDFLRVNEEGERKVEAFCLLREFVDQYLNLVPHKDKFALKETERVLHENALNIGVFSPIETGISFLYLAKYADNLLEQPWRKDFNTIKLTAGYYVHHVASHLQNAHDLLIAAGYVRVNGTTLKLPDGADRNKFKIMSRDCYIASHECQIMSDIWRYVSRKEPEYPLTIGDVVDYRKEYAGSGQEIANKMLSDISVRMRGHKVQDQTLTLPLTRKKLKETDI